LGVRQRSQELSLCALPALVVGVTDVQDAALGTWSGWQSHRVAHELEGAGFEQTARDCGGANGNGSPE